MHFSFLNVPEDKKWPKTLSSVENVNLVLSVGPSALCNLTVVLNTPQLPANVCEVHQN